MIVHIAKPFPFILGREPLLFYLFAMLLSMRELFRAGRESWPPFYLLD